MRAAQIKITQPKRKRFVPNIRQKGRWIRGLIAVSLFGAGVAAIKVHLALGLALIAGGAFVLFEALRGWCALRACGLKTKF
jgi:hypothetical protein